MISKFNDFCKVVVLSGDLPRLWNVREQSRKGVPMGNLSRATLEVNKGNKSPERRLER
jgi:hypothetical protein